MKKDQEYVNTIQNESRRNFINGLTRLVGSAAAIGFLSTQSISVAIAHSLNPLSNEPTEEGKIFSLSQLQQLKSICSIVIPNTDSLGAAEVNTHGFIDNQLFHCHEKSEQDKMKDLLTLIDNTAKKQFALSFNALSKKQQFSLLTNLDLGKEYFNQDQRSDFKSLKRLICFGYYTSEYGASKELRYLAVPGGYKGSIPYKSTDASWGSQGLGY